MIKPLKINFSLVIPKEYAKLEKLYIEQFFVLIFLTLMFIGLLFLYSFTIFNDSVSLKISFIKNPVDKTFNLSGYKTLAFYDDINNKMTISLNNTEIEESVLHEYSHSIYKKCLSSNERIFFINKYANCNSSNFLTIGYKKSQVNIECFAGKYSNFLMKQRFNKPVNDEDYFYKYIFERCTGD